MTKRLHLCISGTLLHDTNITLTGTANGKARSDLLWTLRSYTDCARGPNTAATSECSVCPARSSSHNSEAVLSSGPSAPPPASSSVGARQGAGVCAAVQACPCAPSGSSLLAALAACAWPAERAVSLRTRSRLSNVVLLISIRPVSHSQAPTTFGRGPLPSRSSMCAHSPSVIGRSIPRRRQTKTPRKVKTSSHPQDGPLVATGVDGLGSSPQPPS